MESSKSATSCPLLTTTILTWFPWPKLSFGKRKTPVSCANAGSAEDSGRRPCGGCSWDGMLSVARSVLGATASLLKACDPTPAMRVTITVATSNVKSMKGQTRGRFIFGPHCGGQAFSPPAPGVEVIARVKVYEILTCGRGVGQGREPPWSRFRSWGFGAAQGLGEGPFLSAAWRERTGGQGLRGLGSHSRGHRGAVRPSAGKDSPVRPTEVRKERVPGTGAPSSGAPLNWCRAAWVDAAPVAGSEAA